MMPLVAHSARPLLCPCSHVELSAPHSDAPPPFTPSPAIPCRWHTAAAEARAAKERQEALLAASNPTLGRRGEGLLGARRRQKLAAAAGAGGGEAGGQLMLQSRDDLDALAPQVCALVVG
jgi:hypothetical protein